MGINKILKIITPALFICLLAINILSIQHKGLTYDEDRHYKYGYQILKLNSDRFEDSKMPFSAFNAIPRVVAEKLKPILPQKVADFLYDIKTGRYITIAFSLLLAFYVFKWAKELYGLHAGILALTLYTFSPNITAHSRLITTDLYASCMITISLYYFWRFIYNPNMRTAFISALTLGISQLAKYTCAYLYLIFILIIGSRTVAKTFSRENKEKKSSSDAKINYASKLKYLLVFIITNIIIINAGFLFNKSLTPLSGYKFRSELFNRIQKNSGILKKVPLMLPYPFIEGLDWVKHNERSGVSYSNIYLLGKIKTKAINQEFHGFKNYYLYAFLFKVPLPVQILIIASAAARIFRRKKYKFIDNEIFLIIPIIFFFTYFNFLFNAQLGIRFLLVIFPILHIFCAGIMKATDNPPPLAKAALTGLITWLIISMLSYFPHYISYFNELIGERKNAYKILADSNIDWGQNVWYLEEYKKKHPKAKIEPAYPTTGTIVVSVNSLVGIFNPIKYKWLRENFEPTGHIAYSYLIYKVTPEELYKMIHGTGKANY